MGRIRLPGCIGNLFDIIVHYDTKVVCDTSEESSEEDNTLWSDTNYEICLDHILTENFKDPNSVKYMGIYYTILYTGTGTSPIPVQDKKFLTLEEAINKAKELYVTRKDKEGIWSVSDIRTIELKRPILIALEKSIETSPFMYAPQKEVSIILAGEIIERAGIDTNWQNAFTFKCYNDNEQYRIDVSCVKAWMYTTGYPRIQQKLDMDNDEIPF